MEYSDALALLGGVADNLNNEKISVEINMIIKNLEKDDIPRSHEFKLDLNFIKDNKDQAKILDDLKNLPITDDIVKIDKSTADHFKITDKDEIIDDNSIIKNDRILHGLISQVENSYLFKLYQP